MKIVEEDNKYYIVTDSDKYLISDDVIDAFKSVYGENIPEDKIPYLNKCREIADLDSDNYQVAFYPDSTVKVKVTDKDGNALSGVAINEALKQKEENLSKESKEEVSLKQNKAPLKIRFFEAIKKLNNNKKFKIARNVLGTALITSALAGSFLYAPYAYNEVVNDDFVASHTVVTQEVESDSEYSQCPYTFDDDVVAYLKSEELFGGTYPVAQGDDNNYYLHHNIKGEDSNQGTISKDFRNGEGLSNDFNILYGHNLIDNSMFGKVTEYADKSVGGTQVRDGQNLYDEVKSYDYYDEYGHYEVEIFAAGVYDGSQLYDSVGNFDNEKDYDVTMDYIMDNSDIKTNVDVEYGQKIIALQGCPDGDASDYYTNGNENNRVYVFGVAKQLEKYKDLPSETKTR